MKMSNPTSWLFSIFVAAALCGCATSSGSAVSAVQLKPLASITNSVEAKADLAQLLENRSDEVRIKFNEIFFRRHPLGRVAETAKGRESEGSRYLDRIEASLQAGQVDGVSWLSISQDQASGDIISYTVETTNIAIQDDGFEISPLLYVRYIELTRASFLSMDGSRMTTLYLGMISIGNLPVADAERITHDLSVILSIYKMPTVDQLAVFKAQAARYRALAVKPAISEQQRKYIVQADFLTKQKNYTGAFAIFKKAIELDPVSYPAAYSNMALLAVQLVRYDLAISYMKQYLLLVPPDTKGARRAQDSIYQWETKAPNPQAPVSDHAVRGFLGAQIQSTAAMPGKPPEQGGKGALIVAVRKGMPAERAGLERGDIILFFDGKKIDSGTDLLRLIHSAAGKTADIVFYRDNRKHTVKVDIGKMFTQQL